MNVENAQGSELIVTPLETHNFDLSFSCPQDLPSEFLTIHISKKYRRE
jgi:sporulation-control protein spo0M